MTFQIRRNVPWVALVFIFSGCTPPITVVKQLPAIVIEASLTPLPTAANFPATLTPTVTPLPSPTYPPKALVTPLSLTQGNNFVFIDETIPDGTNFQPEKTFRKTWTLKNGGIHTWDKNFVLARTSSSPANETLGSPERIPLSKEVKPGETIQIGVDLVAPKQNGKYTVFYQLQDAVGSPISSSQIWVIITVGTISGFGSGGITAQLGSASIQASEFTVDFCMQLPDGRQWYPWDVILLANQKQYSPTGSRMNPVGATTAHKCFGFSFPVSISSGMNYQLTIRKVELPPEVHQAENCASAQTTLRAAYPGLDFKCAGPGSWYSNLVLPTGMTKEQANLLILDAMSSSIYGPWVLKGIAP